MTKVISHPVVRVICLYLVFSLAMPLTLPGTTWASFISFDHVKKFDRAEEASLQLRVQLENAYIADRLNLLGLSMDEIEQRLFLISAEERLILLNELKSIQVGGSSDSDTSGSMAIKIIGFTIGFIIGYSLVSSSN